ncbi:2-oxo-4-hydroxy-4-carboxy-5-ureidoimidazoline decarboxylase [Sphaerisporangium rufum]|uniref:2-oxo-4-hydroxy-4-carboxy-5-ureidoimidazoline decarboxylase n=1 Tax=Sphaerisporangium rufum TaxID=1381558 RepID=A0A919QZB4_9ACTN|nr:2-oxo-4-hydroxy-4-carboxy-5-ureidoimidazoline decarboxylase [Sphaerisporangium rufum]GII76103.1 2-oxo-4-hydroxy-4-carboxy-5-ureidoimidazoline decarboxylase [Sphaerisporangium rufum]
MADPTPAGGVPAFDALPPAEAERRLLACCAAPEFARRVAAGRPYGDRGRLLAAAEAAARELGWPQVRAALDAHPRIGDRPAGDGAESRWSRREQERAGRAGAAERDALAEGNRRYEERFGHVFLVCATGLTAGQVLDRLRGRLGNDEETERKVVGAELAAIARLRVARLLDEETT